MYRIFALIALTALFTASALAADQISLDNGSLPTLLRSDDNRTDLFYNHDDSFENAYAWQLGAQVAPSFGAIGEAFSLGATTINGAVFWFTTVSDSMHAGQVCDIYVWEDGIAGEPGVVLAMIPAYLPENIGVHPTYTQHTVNFDLDVDGPFTVGFWGNWADQTAGWLIGADLDGPGGNPWTLLAPGSPYGDGWEDPSVAWGPTNSMGIGVYVGDPSPIEVTSWGEIKNLF
jgi:hypothetical protein